MPAKSSAYLQRHAANTARWRERRQCGKAVYPVEADEQTFEFMERFAGLKPEKVDDRKEVAAALGRLLRRALEALLRETSPDR